MKGINDALSARAHCGQLELWNFGGKNHMSGLRIIPAEQEGRVFTHQYSLVVSRRVCA